MVAVKKQEMMQEEVQQTQTVMGWLVVLHGAAGREERNEGGKP